VKSALVDYVNSLPIGGLLAGIVPWRALVGVIECIEVEGVRHVLQASLATESDIGYGDPSEVAVLDPANIAVTIVQVS